jgi:arabinooligosaccharide transport system permease protein
MSSALDVRPRTGARTTPVQGRRRLSITPYAFVSPFFVLYVLFLLGPTLYAGWLSLQEWAGIGDPTWVGLDNYAKLFSDRSFLASGANTLVFVLASVFVVMPLALVAATALNARGLRGRDMFRVAYFLPIVLSPLLVSIVFTIIFDFEFGLANAVLRGVVGLPPVEWLTTPGWARVAIVLVLIWRYTGYLMIYFLAGLQSIPRDLYEAAELDGAGVLRQFWHVTVPMLRPVTAFVALTVVIGAAQIFEEPFILTNGGPEESTISVAMFIFRAAFERQQFGYAAAAGVVLFVVVFAVTKALSRVLGVGREDAS